MTAKFLEFMEEKAYNVAKREFSDVCFKKNVGERVNKVIPTSELYNMVAGSETGAIIAAALVIPETPGSKVPRHRA